MRVALVYDRVNKWGGAERVLLSLNKMFPHAPLYTSLYEPRCAKWARVFPKIITSPLNNLSFLRNRHQAIPYLMPLAFESFNFRNFNLVISVTSEAAKGIITQSGTRHICYLLTPTRYLWSGYKQYFRNKLIKSFSLPAVKYLRKWDKMAAQRPDKLISISKAVQRRTEKYYNRKSKIVYPPVNVDKFTQPKTCKSKDFYLIVSRLVPYKKVDLAIETFNQNGLPLVIVGNGSEERRLRQRANSNIKFKGSVSDRKLIKIYHQCKGLIFPQNEDFGIVAIEAMASGKPVIAYKKGGALDFIEHGKTGIFFGEQKIDSLQNALSNFSKMKFSSDIITKHAQKFSENRFKSEFLKTLNL